MVRSVADRLQDILDAAEAALRIVSGLDPAAIDRLPLDDDIRFRALENALSEMGEAINALPRDLLARYPQIDWPGFVGLRNIIAHQYHRLDPTMIRRSAITDLPQRIRTVTEMRASLRDAASDGAS